MARAATPTCTGDRGGVLLTAALTWIDELVREGAAVSFSSDPGTVVLTTYSRLGGSDEFEREIGRGPDARQALVNAFCATACVRPTHLSAQGGA